MYMDDIKLFAKNEKDLETLIQNYENIQSRYRKGIWHRKLRHACNKKWQTIHYRRGRTTKSSSHQNTRRKGNLQILGHIGSWHHQTTENERKKIKKRLSQKSQKLLETKLFCRNLVKGINTWTVLLVRYSGLFLRKTLKNGPENKKTNDHAQGIASKRWR